MNPDGDDFEELLNDPLFGRFLKPTPKPRHWAEMATDDIESFLEELPGAFSNLAHIPPAASPIAPIDPKMLTGNGGLVQEYEALVALSTPDDAYTHVLRLLLEQDAKTGLP